MKQFKLGPITLGVMLLVGTATVPAAQGPYIGLNLGYYGFDSGTTDQGSSGHLIPTDKNEDNNADDSFFYGLNLGYQFNDYFALEANYSVIDSETRMTGTTVDGNLKAKGSNIDVNMYRLDALFSMPYSRSFSPYFVIGYAHLDFDPEFTEKKRDMLNLGWGTKYSFTKAISLRGDVRGFFNDNYNEYAVNIGLFYLFDTTAPPPQKTPEVDQCALDDDNDGVGNCDDSCPGTVAGESVDESGCAIVATKEPIRLDVKFASSKAFINPKYFPKLQEVADKLNKNPNATAEIGGHTDSRGREASNQKLSQRRADAVRETLIAEFGVDESRITAVGYGESDPIADNSTTEGRAENRRVVAYIQ